jgi:hypothetical protein
MTMPSRSAQATGGEQALDVLGLDPLDLHVGPVVEAAVLQRLDHRQVGVGQRRTCR